jgi:hypothetical protein
MGAVPVWPEAPVKETVILVDVAETSVGVSGAGEGAVAPAAAVEKAGEVGDTRVIPLLDTTDRQ